ncbi:reverse transcriptase [Gossypium australe]|uniref:Reverse transcriptase n=1 Tax=Gossypium australe TaxID=47621 RepID=A0A5B6V0L3_9ROSI|nr:reverse transcriptase [Gossypium australe]
MKDQIQKSQMSIISKLTQLLAGRFEKGNSAIVNSGDDNDEPTYPLGFTLMNVQAQPGSNPGDNPTNPVVSNLDDMVERERVRVELPKQLEDRYKWLEEKFRAMESVDHLYRVDANELSLVPDLVPPPKFKTPEFKKYNGTSYPETHITMFCRRMTGHPDQGINAIIKSEGKRAKTDIVKVESPLKLVLPHKESAEIVSSRDEQENKKVKIRTCITAETRKNASRSVETSKDEAKHTVENKKEVKKQFDAGFLQVDKYSKWVANIVHVPKKDRKVQICVDYRDLNKASLKDNFLLAHIDTLVDNTAGVWDEKCQKTFNRVKHYLSNAPMLMPPSLDKPLIPYLAVFGNWKLYGMQATLHLNLEYSEVETIHVVPFDLPHLENGYSKAVNESAIVNFLASRALEDYEPVNFDFPNGDLMYATTIEEGAPKEYPWKLSFEGASNVRVTKLGQSCYRTQDQDTEMNKQEDTKPIQMSSYEALAHCYNIEEEERDYHPWTLRRLANEYVLDGEILYKRRKDQVLQRCVAAVEAKKILEEVHECVFRTYANGFTLVKQIMRFGYYWSTIKGDCINYAKRCHKCQLYSDKIHVPPSPLHVMTSS